MTNAVVFACGLFSDCTTLHFLRGSGLGLPWQGLFIRLDHLFEQPWNACGAQVAKIITTSAEVGARRQCAAPAADCIADMHDLQ